MNIARFLEREWDLKDEINIFLNLKKNNGFANLLHQDWLCDFAFSVDILNYLNEFNKILQGKCVCTRFN